MKDERCPDCNGTDIKWCEEYGVWLCFDCGSIIYELEKE